jgi:hypothetical protein
MLFTFNPLHSSAHFSTFNVPRATGNMLPNADAMFTKQTLPLARFSRKTILTWQQNTAKLMQNRAKSRTFVSL